jgi:integrase
LRPLRFDKTPRIRFLTSDEEVRLINALSAREHDMREARFRYNEWRQARHLTACPALPEPYADYLRPMVLVAKNTGLRRGELLKLRWRHVNLMDTRPTLTVEGRTAKTLQTRHIPLNRSALRVLRDWKKQTHPVDADWFVFGASPEIGQLRVDKAWKTVTKLAGLDDFRFHDLRHDFASKLVQKGAPLNTVRELLGHASLEMTMAYAHLSPDGLATAVELVA